MKCTVDIGLETNFWIYVGGIVLFFYLNFKDLDLYLTENGFSTTGEPEPGPKTWTEPVLHEGKLYGPPGSNSEPEPEVEPKAESEPHAEAEPAARQQPKERAVYEYVDNFLAPVPESQV